MHYWTGVSRAGQRGLAEGTAHDCLTVGYLLELANEILDTARGLQKS